MADKRVTAEARFYDDRTDGGKQWVVTLHYGDREEDFDYFTGSAITDEPTVDSVLYALFMDASILAECGNHWEMAEYFGTPATREGEETYDQIVENTEQLRDLLGDDYDAERERIEGLNL